MGERQAREQDYCERYAGEQGRESHAISGSAAKRIWAGEFGAGHAKLQIEGKVVDTQSGEVIAAFAERRRSSGSLGAQDLKGDAGPHIIEHLVGLVSADINSELRASFIARQGEIG